MGKNELISLAFLTIKPMHTYALGKLIDGTQLENWAKVSRASLYACLQKLSQSGEVSVELVSINNYPPRKIFSITEKGKKRYKKEIEAAISDSKEVNSVLFYLGINFFFEVDITAGLAWSEKRKKFLQECAQSVQQNIDEYRQHEYYTPLISVEAIQDNITAAIKGVEKFQKLLVERETYFENFLLEYRAWIEGFELG